MAPDRKLDRHKGERGQHIRIPADLWKRFGSAVGDRNRSPKIAELVAWFLREGPPPSRPVAARKADKTDTTT